uniref:Thiol methyltransferase 1A1 n=1 Tax=Mus musculus TaxID=10090 RepID=A0A2R8VHP5_MOUSE
MGTEKLLDGEPKAGALQQSAGVRRPLGEADSAGERRREPAAAVRALRGGSRGGHAPGDRWLCGRGGLHPGAVLGEEPGEDSA